MESSAHTQSSMGRSKGHLPFFSFWQWMALQGALKIMVPSSRHATVRLQGWGSFYGHLIQAQSFPKEKGLWITPQIAHKSYQLLPGGA